MYITVLLCFYGTVELNVVSRVESAASSPGFAEATIEILSLARVFFLFSPARAGMYYSPWACELTPT